MDYVVLGTFTVMLALCILWLNVWYYRDRKTMTPEEQETEKQDSARWED